ncbi:hypothetical protein BH09ACT1_BH09ACT1_12180 [soil metagenome]
MSASERLKFLFLPWWRVALLVASLLWLIGLNVAYIGGGAKYEWSGILSVIPIWSFTIDVLVRDMHRRKQQRAAKPNQ